ncbi:MAG TPA: ferrochelatase [Anaerolineales bacterium]
MAGTTPMIGVLVMAYGGPDNLDEVEPYLLDVRGHRPTSPEIVHEVRGRYREIGGRSPILEQTQAQADAIQAALGGSSSPFKVFVGMRHWHPHLEDSLRRMQYEGIERAVGVVMAPQYSRMSIGAYYQRIQEANSPIEFAAIQDWHLEPGYLETLVSRIHAALQRFPAEERADVPILFTAHSLPEKIREWNDPYPAQLNETMGAVMSRLGDRPHEFAFQSAAISNEPWLGPDAGKIIKNYAAQGVNNVLLCPIGFVCEHVEILYDVDVVYQRLAKSLGIHLERIQMAGTAPKMIEGLARLVRAKAEESGWV